MNRTTAKQKKLLYYNNGRKCKNGHDPALRITQTGRCIDCERQYHEDRLKIQQKRNRYSVRKPRYFYLFPFPQGDKVVVGPFSSHAAAMTAFERRFKCFYGIEFSESVYLKCRRN